MESFATTDSEPDPRHFLPVDRGELIYRRILTAWFQPGKTKKIPQRSFMPRPWESEDRPGDTDGLSVSRRNLTPIEIAATRPDNGTKMHVAEFSAATAFSLSLNIEPKISHAHIGEAVIPKMNSLDLRDDRIAKQIEEWAIALRDSAHIVYTSSVTQ